MPVPRQLRLLLWKDYLIRKRKLVTLGGIVWATVVMLSIYIVRTNIDNEDLPTCQFPARALPSAGFITFLQSFICTFSNKCSPMEEYEEVPIYESSKITQIQRQFTPILYNNTILSVASTVPNAIKILSTLSDVVDEPIFIELSKNGFHVKDLFRNPLRVKRFILDQLNVTSNVVDSLMEAEIEIQSLMKGSVDRCSSNSISDTIKVKDVEHLKQIVDNLCELNDEQMQQLFMDLIKYIDFSKYFKMIGAMYWKLSGDDSVSRLADTLTATVHLTDLQSFVPEDLSVLITNDVDFSYYNLTIISKIMDIFKPTFGNTTTYQTIRDVTDSMVTAGQYLSRFFASDKNTAEDVIGLVLDHVSDKIENKTANSDFSLGVKKLIGEEIGFDVVDILPRLTSIILKWLSPSTQHDFVFYSTLLSKLLEAARDVININMHIEQVAYNVTLRHPEGVKILMGLDANVVGKGFEALADTDRVQILTSKIFTPAEVFCNVNKLQTFFNVSPSDANILKDKMCTESWKKFVQDMIQSFGIYDVKDSINSMASLVVQETLGRNTSELLYTVDQDFKILKDFVYSIVNSSREEHPNMDWSNVLNVTEDDDRLQFLRKNGRMGKLILVTVHGALAKEVIKQNAILEYKISSTIVYITNLVTAINEQLNSAPLGVVIDVKNKYPQILEMILMTALDETKTYKALSTHSEDIFCNGLEQASMTLSLPDDADREKVLDTLCSVSKVIENGLKSESVLATTLLKLEKSYSPKSKVNWNELIDGLRSLYLNLDKNYTYLFEFKSFGMDKEQRVNIEKMFQKAKDYWLGNSNIKRVVYLSVKVGFRLLDLIDHEVFNITAEPWLLVKYGFQSATGPLIILDDFVNLLAALTSNKTLVTSLPHRTVAALKAILPAIPQLLVDSAKLIASDDTDIDPIKEMMNSDPPWPWSEASLADYLNISPDSRQAIRAVETIFRLDSDFQKEWVEYITARNASLQAYRTQSWNTAVYTPQLFLKFSSVLDSLINNTISLKESLQIVFNGSKSDELNFVSAWEYAIRVMNATDRDLFLRKFFTKVDAVLNFIDADKMNPSLMNQTVNLLWEQYWSCSNGTFIEDECKMVGRNVWKYSLGFVSMVFENVAEDLFTYFKESNDPDTTLLQLMGFTKSTSLYMLYDKLPDFIMALLNSYWDYGFMTQIRRASHSQFWDCEAVLQSITPAWGSRISVADINRIQPYVCPSFLYWLSLPRGENVLLDVVAKPQYYFFTLNVKNITSEFEKAFVKSSDFANLVIGIANKHKNNTQKATMSLQTIQKKFRTSVDNMLSYKVNISDVTYNIFYETNKKEVSSFIYLTRIVAITNKIATDIEHMNISEILPDLSIDDIKKIDAELSIMQKIFKRRPQDAIGFHFDLMTSMLLENNTFVQALDDTCENLKNDDNSKTLLDDDQRTVTQICAKTYKIIYEGIKSVSDEDLDRAKSSLLTWIKTLQNGIEGNVEDVFEILNDRKQLLTTLKSSIKYSYDLGIPIYLKYLQSTLEHYDVILSFLSGENWWVELRELYNGPYAVKFFDSVEKSFEIAEDIINNIDKIHLVRLLRDIDINNTDSFCQPNVTLSDYVPDHSGALSDVKHQMCEAERTELFRELPPLVFASQGYNSDLQLSKTINYTSIENTLSITETKFATLRRGPSVPQRPSWVTEAKIERLREVATQILSQESLVKISFGMLGNVVDAATLFLNNSDCTYCSQATIWFKQLNLQLYKKQEYENLLCHMHEMDLDEVHRTLKNEFHWDMAIGELIRSRNYTKYELNKSLNEFLEEVKIHLLEDMKANASKISECLAYNVTKNGFGNTTLFLNVVAHTTRLIRSVLPYLQDIDGVTELPYLKTLQEQVAPNLDVIRPLNVYVNEEELRKDLTVLIGEKISGDIVTANVNLNKVVLELTRDCLELKQNYWDVICKTTNCTEVFKVINKTLDLIRIKVELPTLQSEEFWRFTFVSDILRHLEALLTHFGRIVGVASSMNIEGMMKGELAAMLDFVMELLMDNTISSVVYSIQGVVETMQPFLKDTPLEQDLKSLAKGLEILKRFKRYLIEDADLKVHISELFGYPEHLEMSFNELGINNTNFWSIAAPRIHSGYIDLKPLFTQSQGVYRISNFVCQPENMSAVIIPSNIDVVTLDDVYGAVIEQFCGINDAEVKKLIPVLVENVNFSVVVGKVSKVLLAQLYATSNLTEAEGSAVLENVHRIAELIPIVQKNVVNITEMLSKEPLFQSLKDFKSVGGLLSSDQFLDGAGRMMCGKPFVNKGNRFYKAVADTEDFANEPDPEQLAVLPSDFCRDLYKDILKTGGGKIVWSFIKPFIMGQILYTPSNPMVHKIVEKANSTFAHMSKLANIVHSFANSLPSIDILLLHRQGIDVLKRLMTSPGIKQLTGLEMPTIDWDLDQLFDRFGDGDMVKDFGNLLGKASDLLRCVNLNRFHSMPDEQALSHEAVKLTRISEFYAGLVFTSVSERDGTPINVEYKIRMDIESVPTTSRLRNQFWTPGPESNFLENMRYFRGFVQMQDIIDSAIIELSQNKSQEEQTRKKRAIEIGNKDHKWAIYTQQTPYPCYRQDFFQSSLYESQALVVAFFFSLLLTVSSAVRFIVSDKESGNTMLMSVMGVNLSYHTLSWCISSFIEILVTCACITAVLCGGGVLPKTDPFLLFVMMVAFGFSVVMFCYMMSKLFNSASFAAVCTALAYLVTFMPYIIILSLEAVLSYMARLVTCLSMSTAFCYSILYVVRFETIGNGAHWADLWTAPGGGDDMSIGLATFMVLIDGLIYFAIGFLIDKFFGLKTLKSNITHCVTSTERAGVSILNVTKVYKAKSMRPKLALDNVSIELHKGQITTLLGHNGAGKTTLIKILTGMLKPTKGHVVIRSERDAPTRIGVCPQRDVLFEYMSAREHITLYAQLKSGLPTKEVQDEVHSMLKVLSLGQLSDEPVCRLSGGSRRRVCVSLAFVGRPGLVSLDEPTAQVDPAARRDIWSLIMKLREDRTVLFTTHHLDEAELLSDQIVIMHKGQIHTIGSPIEIKRSLGNGYKLTVTYPEKTEEKSDDNQTLEESTKLLLSTVREVAKNAQLMDVSGEDVEIAVPFFDANGLNNDFLSLCNTMEASQEALGFSRYTMDCSSLEQVFTNICQKVDGSLPPNEIVTSSTSFDSPTISSSTLSVRTDRTPLVDFDGPLKGTKWQQFLALLQIRYTHYIRNKWLLFLLIVLPSLFVSIAMAFSLIRPPADNEVALQLHPGLYKDSTDFLVSHPSTDSAFAESSFAQRVMDVLRFEKDVVRNWTDMDSPSCKCTDVKQVCNTSGTVNVPPMMILPDTRILNDWLVTSQEVYMEKRYGGFSSSLHGNNTKLIAWYNNKGHHALPSYVNALNDAILKSAAGQEAGITTFTHPLKISKEQLSKSTILQHLADAGISAIMLVAYCLVCAGSAIYLVGARIRKEKRLQLLCGISPAMYWSAALVTDMIVIVINILITSIVLESFGYAVFVARSNLSAICILLFLFGYACSCLVHLVEKLFTDPSMANMILFCANVFVGLSGITILLILDIISESDRTDHARRVLHKVFMICPQFVLIDALIEIAKNTIQAEVLSRFGMDTYKDPVNSGLISAHYVSLLLVGTALFLLNLAVEYDSFETLLARFRKEPNLDDGHGEMESLEVAAERKRVRNTIAQRDARPLRLPTIGNINAGFVDTIECTEKQNSIKRIVTLDNDVAQCEEIGKVYPGLFGDRVAVRSFALGIPPSQCTALLGQNGAGKSTVFAMMTGEVRPSAGAIYLDEERATARSLCKGLISYCPQTDAIDPLLTVRETLKLYCQLRGLDRPDETIKRTVDMFDLSNYTDIRTGRLSGGNKRKLCTAIAFMGRTPLVLLDEPTSGMDPGSRICVQRGVQNACLARRGVLLSTHQLHDARRLCARVALMRNGSLCALSSLHNCLDRFGGGYIVSCRVSHNARNVWKRIKSAAPHAALQSLHHTTVQFLLPNYAKVGDKEITTPLSDIFRLMAELQSSCDIEDFTINQSSLDQMFLSFTDRADQDIEEMETTPALQKAPSENTSKTDSTLNLADSDNTTSL